MLLTSAAVALPAEAATGRALINADTVSGGADSVEAKDAVAAGLAVDVVSGAVWSSMTADQFGSYQVLIAGDPTCSILATSFTANVSIWGPVVLGKAGGRSVAGNRVVIGTDPIYHAGSHPGAYTLVQDGINFASAQPGRTGLYFDDSCGGAIGQTGLAASVLQQVSTGSGTWTENDSPPCGGSVAMIASTGKFDTLHTDDLQGWGCSVHETFPHYASDWSPLAVATDTASKPTCGTDSSTGATACGEAYVLIAGSDIVATAPDLKITPSTSTDEPGGSHTVTATLARSGLALVGQAVTFTVSGVNSGVPGSCDNPTCVTNSAGQVSFTYPDTNGAGDDTIAASFTDAASGTTESATAAEHWGHAAQTLTVTATDVSSTYGQANPAFPYTVTSTGSDVLASAATCAVAGTSNSAGSYPITCSGATVPAGDTVVYVAGTFTIAQAPLTVTAPSPNVLFGAPAAGVSFAPTVGGLVNGDTPDTAGVTPLTCSSTAVATAGGSFPAGSYPVTCTGVSNTANYTVSYLPGTLTVTKAVLTVTGGNATRPFGAANPTFTTAITGLVNGDTAGQAITGTPVTGTPAMVTDHPGTYPVTVGLGTLKATNYTFALVPGVLTITKASTALSTGAFAPTSLSVSATLVYGAGSTPAAGQVLSFLVNTTVLCTSTTDVRGTATCVLTPAQLAQVAVNGGYTAKFATTVDLLASTANGTLLQGLPGAGGVPTVPNPQSCPSPVYTDGLRHNAGVCGFGATLQASEAGSVFQGSVPVQVTTGQAAVDQLLGAPLVGSGPTCSGTGVNTDGGQHYAGGCAGGASVQAGQVSQTVKGSPPVTVTRAKVPTAPVAPAAPARKAGTVPVAERRKI